MVALLLYLPYFLPPTLTHLLPLSHVDFLPLSHRAFPIARALNAGADVVVTGRCVDSALALGPLIHKV